MPTYATGLQKHAVTPTFLHKHRAKELESLCLCGRPSCPLSHLSCHSLLFGPVIYVVTCDPPGSTFLILRLQGRSLY